MANRNRRAGIIYLKVSGRTHDVKGSFTYNIGQPKREGIVGHDGVHGFKELPQIPFIEGEITDASDLDLKSILNYEDETVTLELNNGKTIVLSNAWFAGDGNVSTEDGNIAVRFEGKSGKEI